MTRNAQELANTLNPLIGSTTEINETCVKLVGLARRHHNLCERECSDPRWGRSDELRIERLESKIIGLIESLPETEDGPFTEYLQRDPRGCTVKMRINNMERHPAYNGWALEAIIVPA